MRALFFSIGILAACVDTHRPPHTTDAGSDGDCASVEQDVSVRSSADVANLPKGCWDLYGKLTLDGSDITSMSMLGDIRSANDIEIMNTGLTTFDTQSPVDMWYGAITVSGNMKLTTLKNLTIHDGHVASVAIDGNPLLTTFELTGLEKIDADLSVSNDVALTDITLKSLTTIGGGVSIENDNALKTVNLGTIATVNRFDVENNPLLTSIVGVPSQQVLGDFVLRSNKALTQLTGMSSLNRIRGTLTLDHNDALTTLAIPANQVTLEGALVVTNNANLADLGGISHFYYIYSINITGNSQLAYCTTHEVLQCVSNYGNWTINNNKSNTTTNCSYWCQ